MNEQAIDTNHLYACPRTGVPLTLEGDELRSREGHIRYPMSRGLPQFLRFPPREANGTAEELSRLNRICLEKGWRVALEEVYGPESRLYRYVTNGARAAYLDLMPLTPRSIVLDVGAGLGQFTSLLAERVGFVYALEVVPGQAEFSGQRCRQQRTPNVSVACGGDDCRLPYRSDGFDIVVCNLVLEWCAARDNERPRDGQARLLDEIFRVLKPGGWLYLATKNRFSLRYLLGGRDEHSRGLRFGSALPEWLRLICLRFAGSEGHQGYLYSYLGLKRLLGRHGLLVREAYWAAPEFRHPDHFVKLQPAHIRAARRRSAFIQGSTRLTRLVMPLVPAGLVKHVTPGLAVLAQKPS